MKIGIVGAGNIGATLARKLVASGHAVKISSTKSPDDLRELANEVGATPVHAFEAVKDVDVVVASIPYGRNPELAGLFSGLPADTVIIDTSNYYPVRDGNIPEVDSGKPESVWSSEQFGRPVIKAFNAILADVISNGGKPYGAPGRLAIPVAGDNAAAKAVAMQLVDDIGFDPVDSGTLGESWRQQPGSPAYCTSLKAPELREALSETDKARSPLNLAALMGQLSAGWPTTEVMTAWNRELSARA